MHGAWCGGDGVNGVCVYVHTCVFVWVVVVAVVVVTMVVVVCLLAVHGEWILALSRTSWFLCVCVGLALLLRLVLIADTRTQGCITPHMHQAGYCVGVLSG